MLRHIKTYRARRTANVGDVAFGKREQTDRCGADVEDRLDVVVPQCASCGGVIHEPIELGGYCNQCHKAVCQECRSRRCAIHHRILCSGCIVTKEGFTFCLNDSVWAIACFLLSVRESETDHSDNGSKA